MRSAVAIACLLLGCKGEPKAPPEPAKPSAPTFELSGTKLRCSDGSCEGEIGGQLDVTLTKVVDGAKLTAGGRTGPPAASGIAVAIPDVKKLVAKANLAEILTKGMPLDISLELPGGTKIAGTVQVPADRVIYGVGVMFRTVDNEDEPGFKFEGETAQTKTGTALFYASSSPQLFGEAKQVGDIGRIALLAEDSREKSCGKYKSDDGRTEGSFEIRMIDATVTVHDRISGRALGRKKFPALGKPECPKSFQSIKWEGASEYTDQLNFDEKAVAAWLRDVQSGAVPLEPAKK